MRPAGAPIRMNDLHAQYLRLKEEIDAAIWEVLNNNAFINGPQVKRFAGSLADYLNVPYVIPCANGTDALQIAMMALGLSPGDELIIPAFNYASAAEAARLLGLIPVWADIKADTFNLDVGQVEQVISSRTKAIVPVHLFGQSCNMETVMEIARQYRLYVIEDNAQSIGSEYRFRKGKTKKAGTIGHIGITSFFPSKPLACYGDGGALMTADTELAKRIRMIANHGQEEKYRHLVVGCNSRLDTLQAAILEVKLAHLDAFNRERIKVAERYHQALQDIPQLKLPLQTSYSTHIYSQYTVQVAGGKRDALKEYLNSKEIPTLIYYPTPLPLQEAYGKPAHPSAEQITVAAKVAASVLSLPIHTEMTNEMIDYIIGHIREFFL
ncbi:MAG: DegT/DnrJ/EryC1/StrS family aminotransferase [Bacteroidales bacterium]